MNLINYVGKVEQKTKVRIGPTVNRAKCDREERRKHSIGFSLEDANGDRGKPATNLVMNVWTKQLPIDTEHDGWKMSTVKVKLKT